jgi:hypothetical protein
MRINGQWLICDDGSVRPVIIGDVLAVDGSWVKVRFLVDTGADRTVFSADVLNELQLPRLPSLQQLGGVGGEAVTVRVETQLRLFVEDGGKATFRSQFSAFSDLDALDMSAVM